MMFFPLTRGGNLIQSNQNFMVGSKFSNCIWGEVNDGWGHVKVFFKGDVKYVFPLGQYGGSHPKQPNSYGWVGIFQLYLGRS